jgi:hypothetical protein
MQQIPAHSWEAREDQLRADWERNYPNTPWSDISLGYRYGWEYALHSSPTAQTWEEAEQDLARSWNNWQASHRAGSLGQHVQLSWESIRAQVRHGWEQARQPLEKQR